MNLLGGAKNALSMLGKGAQALNTNPHWQSALAINAGRDPMQVIMAYQDMADKKKKDEEEKERQEKLDKFYQTLLGSPSTAPGTEESAPMLGNREQMMNAMLSSGVPELQKMGLQGMVRPGAESPSNVREWEYFQGLSPKDQQKYLAMKRSSQIKDFGGHFGNIDPLTNQVTNVGNKTLAPHQTPDHAGSVESSKVLAKDAAEKSIGAPQAALKKESLNEGIDNTMEAIDGALSEVGWNTSGVTGAVLSKIPGTDAYDLKQTVLTVKANIGFDRLQAMREASPTGGALGQVAIQELNALQASVASLDTAQSPDQLARNLEAVRKHYQNWKEAYNQAHDQQYGGGGGFSGFEIID